MSSVAEIIKLQHDRLKAMDVSLDHIESILKGRVNYKVLLLVDGYDEYTRGTNRYIDAILESRTGSYFLILTSRPGDHVPDTVRDSMDGIVMVTGFSLEKISRCSAKFLDSEEKSQQMILEARQSGIKDFLYIPIILLMTCVVYAEKRSLPKTKTGIVGIIYELMMDRTTLKTFGCKSRDVPNLDKLLYLLGEVAWKALQKDSRQLFLNKVNVNRRVS